MNGKLSLTFNFLMKYVAGWRCDKTDDKSELETFYIFTYFYVGGGWCWKEFFDQCFDRMFKKEYWSLLELKISGTDISFWRSLC